MQQKEQNPWAMEVEDLTVAYDIEPVLWDVDLGIPTGTLTAVIGPNGAGKSTLLKAVLKLVRCVAGKVRIHAERVAYVPQSGSVDWDFPATVRDVVLMGRYGHLGWFRRPRAEDRRIAMDTLSQVGMSDFAARQISRLSGGQQQRVFLARALAQEADLYLMDEPFRGVDAQTERLIVELLKRLKDEGKTVVVVHHDLQTVRSYFDRAVLLNLRLIADGPTNEVFTDENIRRTYRSTETLLGESA